MKGSAASIPVHLRFVLLRLLIFATLAMPFASGAALLRFQQGVNGYTGIVDATLRQDFPTINLGNAITLYASAAPSASVGQSLIRFDNIFGDGTNQIPPGATILSATLALRTGTSAGAATTNEIRLHRMLMPWAATNTWATLLNGIAPDDFEAAFAFDAAFAPLSAPRTDTLDVIAALQSWSAGASNYGWAILATGPDTWLGESSEAAANRPVLNVTFVTGVPLPVGITAQPQSQSNLSVGTNIQLSVTATGSAPRYLWFKNGKPIPDATNSTLVFRSLLLGDTGTYSVVVSNSLGFVTSSNAILSVLAQPTIYDLVNLTNTFWRFTQTRGDLGTAWREINYNDSAFPWLTGRGVFAFENNAVINTLTNTVLQGADGVDDVITYYFRTQVVLTNDLSNLTLVSSNYVDDGMVVYVNGKEAFRYNMSSGNIAATSLAPAANPAGEGVPIVSNIPPSFLIRGTNVIAVEVHQNASTSSDIVFGMNLKVLIPPPTELTITNEPVDVVVEETKGASLAVGVSGTGAQFQWFRENGVAISNATGPVLTIPVTTTNDAGNYYVVVSNAFNFVVSRLARLTVLADTNPPSLLDADGTPGSINVIVSFSEAITSETATNLSNYRITNTLTGATLAIQSAVQINPTNVSLATAPRTSGQNYILVANNLRDISARGNVIATNASAPITSLVRLIGPAASFAFFDPFPPFDPPAPNPVWKDPSFVPGPEWGSGQSVFFQGPNESAIPGPVGKYLSSTPVISSFFRKTFELRASSGGLRLMFNHIIDDGAVFYVNGAEIFRFNLPDGPLNYQTAATQAVGNAVLITTIVTNPPVVFANTNVLAVELHQVATNDSDKVFSLEMDAVVQSFVVGPVVLTRSPQNKSVPEFEPVIFDVVQAGGNTFQWFQNDLAIPGATNATYFIASTSFSLNGATFRVRVSNATGSVLSEAATLTVLPDATPPVLLSAVATTNAVSLSFSKALTTSTATNPLNYRVITSTGALAPVSRAIFTNGTNVILTLGNTFTSLSRVVVNNVADTSSLANVVASGSTVSVGVDYLIPMESAWKYLLTNTNETIQSTYFLPSFDDSMWPGPSNALFYVESDALAGPKTTELSLFVPGTLDARINTYYFRKSFFTPVGSTNVSIQLRQVVDDGLVLYLNGIEIYRFGFSPGPITAASQPANHENALEGPFFITNVTVLAGNNVLAAEVHQNGKASADMAFGVELSFAIPSIRLEPECTFSPPNLSAARAGSNIVFSWTNSCPAGAPFVLEEATSFSFPSTATNWKSITTNSPYSVLPTNAARFYRLRN